MGYYAQLDHERNYQADLPDEDETAPQEEAETAASNTPDATPPPVTPPKQTVPADDEAAKRQAHEAAEAKRRAEWEAEQEKKRAAEREQLDRLAAMSDGDVVAAAVNQVNDATDKMTNRSMKDSVSAHLQAKCQTDPAFARLVMHPRKSMLHCIQYIFRQARDYLEKELKAGGVKPNSAYGGDVPDGMCYQWAEDYFRDPDAKEDSKDDDKFVERPYYGGRTTKPKAKPAPKPAPKPKGYVEGQLSLLGEAG